MTRGLTMLLRMILWPVRWKFEWHLRHPKFSQERVLKQITKKLSRTKFGRSRSIKSGDSYEAFCFKIPVAEFDQIEPWIKQQMASEEKVLVADPVEFYEATSGSSGRAKLIPYTANLKRTFNEMFVLWMHDLLCFGPKLKKGRFFFSVSPRMGPPASSEHGKPIGLSDDSQYLSRPLRWLLNRYFVQAPAMTNSEAFRIELADRLADEKDLEVISIWSPGFLHSILRTITEHGLSNGKSWRELWPDLKVISCWGSASSLAGAIELRRLFPHVFVQFKGLLATEAPITFPLMSAHGMVPMVNRIYYEFIDAGGKILQLHEVREGEEYEVVLSHESGLYRYSIGDRVRVTHFYRSTPCFEFLGREGSISDLAGEKLHEEFVANEMNEAGFGKSFVTLVPRQLPMAFQEAPYYVALFDGDGFPSQLSPEEAARAVERALSRAHHYKYARHLGQLQACRLIIVEGAHGIYEAAFLQKGIKWGDIKSKALISDLRDADRLMSHIASKKASLEEIHLNRSTFLGGISLE